MADKHESSRAYRRGASRDWYEAYIFAFNAAILAAIWSWLIPLPVIGLLWLVGVL